MLQLNNVLVEMFGSCVAVLVMGVVYEALKTARQWLKDSALKHMRDNHDNSGNETPVNDEDIILRTPKFLTGFACTALVLAH